MTSRPFWRCCHPGCEGLAVRHVVEVRHESFHTSAFVDLLREFSVAAALVDSDKHPLIADVTSDLVYAAAAAYVANGENRL